MKAVSLIGEDNNHSQIWGHESPSFYSPAVFEFEVNLLPPLSKALDSGGCSFNTGASPGSPHLRTSTSGSGTQKVQDA